MAGASKRADEDDVPEEGVALARSGSLAPGLHVVATPIGNLGDMTDRARLILAEADLIACEDTRVSLPMLRRFNITTPCVAYHEHNGERMRPKLMAMLEEGKRVALISDAGTPLVSDPGFKLARAVIEAGYRLHAAPGASAVLMALVLSGLPSDRFMFAGFLDAKRNARRRDLETLALVPASLVFFESAHRLADSLEDMAEMLGDRPAAVARELTKLYEEVRRGSLPDLARHYQEVGPPKGEIAVVVGPPLPKPVPDADDLDAALTAALASMSVRDAAAAVAASLGLNRRTVYARALELAKAAAP